MGQDYIPLTTLNSDIYNNICTDECGAKCCKFRVADHYAAVDITTYHHLYEAGLSQFVEFYSDYYDPLLQHQPNGDCIFLHDDRCVIYEMRPHNCLRFPFGNVKKAEEMCILYERASDELRDQREQDLEEMEFDDEIGEEALRNYLYREELQEVEYAKDLKHEQQIHNEDMIFWLQSKNEIEDIREFIEELVEPYLERELGWYIISLTVFDEELEPTDMVEGMLLNDHNPEFMEKDELDREEYLRLLNIIKSAKELHDHLISGGIIRSPQKIRQRVQEYLESDPEISSGIY